MMNTEAVFFTSFVEGKLKPNKMRQQHRNPSNFTTVSTKDKKEK